MRIRRYLREIYHQPKVALSLKTRKVKAEAIEALLYGCSTWTLRQEHLRQTPHRVHHRVLLRIIGAQRKRPDHRITSYNRALEITRCESTETTLRTKILLWAGALIRISGGRLPKRIVFGNLEGAVRRGQGVCVCVFFLSILDIKFVGRTSRGHTGGRSHRIFNPPSFCGACLDFSREKDSAIPFPRRP